MIYVLCLNDMRSSKIENVQPVAWSDDRGALERFLINETAPCPYSDSNEQMAPPNTFPGDSPFGSMHGTNERWRKYFRKGGPLEWFNPPDFSGTCGIIPLPSIELVNGVPMQRVLDGVARIG